jgi:tRNA(fMet)-specific endonuclease VapC
MTTFLLDTNAYGRFILGNVDIAEAITGSDITYMSIVVIGELYAGFFGGSKYRKNVEGLKYILETDNVRTLSPGPGTAEIYGEIKANLRKKGGMIPQNDIWIAAQCIETGAALITFDDHFKDIPGVRLWRV